MVDHIINNYCFSGRRIKRGLYKTKDLTLINADVNGSINILRKEIGNDWLKPIIFNRGFVVDPMKVMPSQSKILLYNF